MTGQMPDIHIDTCGLLICGINPSPRSAATQAPYATPGNRFWPALHKAGIVPRLVNPAQGLSDDDVAMLAECGIGFTRLVSRPTKSAAELERAEYIAGGKNLAQKVAAARRRHVTAAGQRKGVVALPATVLVLGLGAYRLAYQRPQAKTGPQPDHRIGGALTWLAPNPSGINAHETVTSLADIFQAAWRDHQRELAERTAQ